MHDSAEGSNVEISYPPFCRRHDVRENVREAGAEVLPFLVESASDRAAHPENSSQFHRLVCYAGTPMHIASPAGYHVVARRKRRGLHGRVSEISKQESS